MKIYLDNCCYNRPYDDQSQLRISLETQAKIQIQRMVQEKRLELASSFVMEYENSRNPNLSRKQAISEFLQENVTTYISGERVEEVRKKAKIIQETGVKTADALHTACSILSGSDFMITTDDRLLKYQTNEIRIVNPMEFIRLLGEGQ